MKRRNQPYETAVSWRPSHHRDRVITEEILAVFDLEYRSACVKAMADGVSGIRRLRARVAYLNAQRALDLPVSLGGGLTAAKGHMRLAQRELGLYGQEQLAIARRGVRVGGLGRETR